jgi:hypothetical protein
MSQKPASEEWVKKDRILAGKRSTLLRPRKKLIKALSLEPTTYGAFYTNIS